MPIGAGASRSSALPRSSDARSIYGFHEPLTDKEAQGGLQLAKQVIEKSAFVHLARSWPPDSNLPSVRTLFNRGPDSIVRGYLRGAVDERSRTLGTGANRSPSVLLHRLRPSRSTQLEHGTGCSERHRAAASTTSGGRLLPGRFRGTTHFARVRLSRSINATCREVALATSVTH